PSITEGDESRGQLSPLQETPDVESHQLPERSLDRIRYVRRTLTGDHYRRGRRDPSDRRHYSVIIHNSSPVGRANGRGIDLTSSCVVNGQSQPASPALDQTEPLVRPHHLGLEQFMQRSSRNQVMRQNSCPTPNRITPSPRPLVSLASHP
uniref:Uncharacterized protein n=1 Tax=Amphimedon queenslandica TaxID=400682 RepID=A0A1X7SIX3_AMPQE